MCNNKNREVINPNEFGTFGIRTFTSTYIYINIKEEKHIDL